MDSSRFMEQVHNTFGLTVNKKNICLKSWRLSQAVHTSLHDADLLIHWLFPFILFSTPPFPPIEDKAYRACHRVPFPVPQPSFPSAPKADLPPQSMCIHDLRGHCSITVLVCFRPVIYGQSTTFHYCQMLKTEHV